MPINAVGNDFSTKKLEINAGEQQIAQVKAQKLPALPADSVHFSGREEDKKSSNNGLTTLSLLALAGLGIIFRKNISKFLGIGKNAAEKGVKGSVEAVASKAKEIIKHEYEATAKKVKPVKEWIESRMSKSAAELKGSKRTKKRNIYKEMFDSNRHKELEALADQRIAQRAKIADAYEQTLKSAGERYARSFDNNADKFKDVMNQMFG